MEGGRRLRLRPCARGAAARLPGRDPPFGPAVCPWTCPRGRRRSRRLRRANGSPCTARAAPCTSARRRARKRAPSASRVSPSCARIYDGGEAYLLSDGARSALLRAGGLTVSAIAAFDCAAFYGDRLWLAYAGEAGKVRYGAPASTDLASARGGGGEISFPSAYGQIAALLPFGDSLLLFRERGVQRAAGAGETSGTSS